ncbi:DUF2844 domain-containing protein [Paraburkholderia ferrariae]|uniref:DUF2844 domain-containing protein n=1 Tax=Paraburkholderia ferrariae TaxID=386056 RepID=UPI0006938EC6|nr:DUF2844 domain-containing protein [Paraburkholderia ferrariae]
MKCERKVRRIGAARGRLPFVAALVLFAFTGVTPAAFAELGGMPTLGGAAPQTSAPAASRAKEVAHATDSTAGAATSSAFAWSSRETTLANGTVEREYVGADGLVFAVAWRGPRRPELSTLLGAGYATQMAQSARLMRKAGLGSHSVTSLAGGTFAARAIVRQRYSAGIAWLPQKLPAGVKPDALGIVSGT